MADLGYVVIKKQGSRRRFFNKKTGRVLMLHEPHPGKELKRYCVRNVIKHLRENGLINE
ncbi:MAG: type II toxin-antitoxin system HicA family toxin [Candidatus Sabulitectum sp.]|nr:type II toxin-antitoxin system HicA family toxin [Candidatus Sabulitectum sp.]